MTISIITINNPTVLMNGEAASVPVSQAILGCRLEDGDQLDLVLTNGKDKILPAPLEEMRFNVSGLADCKHTVFEMTGCSFSQHSAGNRFVTTVIGTCRKISP